MIKLIHWGRLNFSKFFKKSLDEDASGAEIEIEGGRDK